ATLPAVPTVVTLWTVSGSPSGSESLARTGTVTGALVSVVAVSSTATGGGLTATPWAASTRLDEPYIGTSRSVGDSCKPGMAAKVPAGAWPGTTVNWSPSLGK